MESSNLVQFGNLEILARQVVEGFITGMHKSPFHGFSVEFAEHRIYNQGESTRHIDWKLFGRTDRLYTKKYEEETNLRCQMVLDISGSMFFPLNQENTKMRYALYSIASLIELLKRQRDAFGVSLFSDELMWHSPCKSSSVHQRYLYTELEKQLAPFTPKKNQQSQPSKILHEIAELIHKRSMVCLFTDFLSIDENTDDFIAALNHLKHAKHEVVIFHVFSRDLEMDFKLDNRPYRLVDMETGEEIRMLPNDFKLAYQKNVNKYFSDIKLKCGDHAIDYVPVVIEEDYNQILIQYLIKRQKMMR